MEDRSTGLVRRGNYHTLAPVDWAIVTGLRNWIEKKLKEVASKRDAGEIGKRMLDVGCGSQPFRSLLLDLGFDYSSVDIEQNKEKSVHFIHSLDFPGLKNTLGDETFDLILCTEVLEHVFNWDAAFTNLGEVLKPGGFLLVTCPHAYHLHEEPYDYWRATNYALVAHAEKAGLKAVSFDYLGNTWDVLTGVLGALNPIARNKTFLMRTSALLLRVFAKKIIFPISKSSFLRRAFEPGGKYYLSNAIVLTK